MLHRLLIIIGIALVLWIFWGIFMSFRFNRRTKIFKERSDQWWDRFFGGFK